MACSGSILQLFSQLSTMNSLKFNLLSRNFHQTAACYKVRAGRYKTTPKRDRPLTYEMAQKPNKIAHRKTWKSWNTSNLLDGLRPSESAVEDLIIRQFVTNTWHNLFVSDILIKRRYNLVIVAGILHQNFLPGKMYFLIGYTEEMLSYIVKCPVKLELQTVPDKKDVIFKYI